MTLKQALLTTIFVVLLATTARASCVDIGGDERLQNYCLLNEVNGKIVDGKTAVMIDKRLQRTGQTSTSDFGTYNRSLPSFSMTPILRYEENINGGNAAKPLVIGGVSFEGDKDFYQTSGIVGGLGIFMDGRTIFGESRYLNYSLNGSYAFNPSGGEIITINVKMCSLNHIKKSWYIDACANQSRSIKNLAVTANRNLKLVTSHIFTGTNKKYNQLEFGYNRLFTSDYTQNQVTVGIETLHSNNIHTGLEATLGEAIHQKIVTRTAIGGILSSIVVGKPLRLRMSVSDANGGLLLGAARDAKTASISVSYPVWRNLTATLGYAETNSTIDYFDTSGPTLALDFDAIKF